MSLNSGGYRTGKGVFIPIPKKGNTKEYSNYHTITLISHVKKVILKILQDRFQQYVNWELPDVQAGFRKGRGTRDKIANICWIIEKAREFQGGPEARSRLCVCRASFLMTFAMGGVPHAGSRQASVLPMNIQD